MYNAGALPYQSKTVNTTLLIIINCYPAVYIWRTDKSLDNNRFTDK